MPGALEPVSTRSRDPFSNRERSCVQEGVLGDNAQKPAHLFGEAGGFRTGCSKEEVAQYLLIGQLLVTKLVYSCAPSD